jgi:hypothetical protein
MLLTAHPQPGLFTQPRAVTHSLSYTTQLARPLSLSLIAFAYVERERLVASTVLLLSSPFSQDNHPSSPINHKTMLLTKLC